MVAPTSDKEEVKMSGGELPNRGYANRRSRPYYHRRCKCKSSSTNIESLPDELVFEILLRLPADDIYNGARFVCKKWHDMIHNRKFVYQHLHHSTSGLVIHYHRQRKHTSFLTMGRGKVEISKFCNYNFKCQLLTSYNGLLLECERENDDSPYIANPSTNQRLALPPKYYCSIAYAAASMVYKVVNPYYRHGGDPEELHCLVLTVGVDKSWRYVNDKHLSLAARKGLRYVPLTTEGFVHWPIRNGAVVVTLTVETEVITEIPVPRGYGEKWKYYLSTGTSLTFLTNINQFSWEVWELRQETGEWTKLPKIIDLKPQKGKILNLSNVNPSLVPPNCTYVTVMPVGWLNCREVLVLHAYPTRLCVVYNVRTQEIDFFELDHDFDKYRFMVHRNSLVRLGGC